MSKTKREKRLERKNEIYDSVSVFTILNPLKMRSEMNKLRSENFSGYNYSKFLTFCFMGLLAFCVVLKMEWPYILSLVILAGILLPGVYYINARNRYELDKYIDASAYIEQLLYSFKRKPKILNALEDTLLLFSEDKNSHLRQAIEDAINYIKDGRFKENIYKEAFAFIEKEYGCKRMYKAHEFLIKVENAGGEADESVNILLDDRNLWVERINALLQSKQKVRINVSIAIGLSLVIVAMSTYMIPNTFKIIELWSSQLARTIALALDMLIWYAVQKMLGKSLLKADGDIEFSKLKHSYDIVMKKKKNNASKIIYMIFGSISIVFAIGVGMKAIALSKMSSVGSFGVSADTLMPAYLFAIMAFLGFGMLLFTQQKRQYRACLKRIKREVEKTFPEWLLSVALQLQTDNVHVSIAKSVNDAHPLLKEELVLLQDRIEQNPNSLQPYVQFFKVLDIPDIMTAMKMLYAMSEFGSNDAQEQIRSLVKRNMDIMDKAERMRMEDQLSGISFAMLLPMITGVIPMLTNLVLVMVKVLSEVQRI